MAIRSRKSYFNILAEIYGWSRRTRDSRGHVWAFIGYRLVEPHDWYGREEIIERATWECTGCGLHMFMDCKYPWRRKIEPVPGTLTWSCGGNTLCVDRQLEQAVWLCHDDRHPDA
jgi:hypothetical protein